MHGSHSHALGRVLLLSLGSPTSLSPQGNLDEATDGGRLQIGGDRDGEGN